MCSYSGRGKDVQVTVEMRVSLPELSAVLEKSTEMCFELQIVKNETYSFPRSRLCRLQWFKVKHLCVLLLVNCVAINI